MVEWQDTAWGYKQSIPQETAIEAGEGGFSAVSFKISWEEMPELGTEIILTSDYTNSPVNIILEVRPYAIP